MIHILPYFPCHGGSKFYRNSEEMGYSFTNPHGAKEEMGRLKLNQNFSPSELIEAEAAVAEYEKEFKKRSAA